MGYDKDDPLIKFLSGKHGGKFAIIYYAAFLFIISFKIISSYIAPNTMSIMEKIYTRLHVSQEIEYAIIMINDEELVDTPKEMHYEDEDIKMIEEFLESQQVGQLKNLSSGGEATIELFMFDEYHGDQILVTFLNDYKYVFIDHSGTRDESFKVEKPEEAKKFFEELLK